MTRQLFGTRARRWLIGIAVAVGVLAAAGLVAVTPAADRTFAGVSNPVQSLISVVVPLYGVVGTAELRRSRNRAGLCPVLVAAMLATVVLPLGLWFLLGAAQPLTAARGWLTPFEWLAPLLAGSMTAFDWVHEVVDALLWGPVLLAIGWSRLRPRS